MMSPSGTQYNVCGTQTVYYGKTLFASDAQSVTTDSSGAASITFPEAGDWYVWANGAKGKSTNNVVSSPAYAAVTVEAGGGAKTVNLLVPQSSLEGMMDLHRGGEKLSMPGTGETLLNDALAEALGVSVGDTVTLRVLNITLWQLFYNSISLS